jgi:hypothetical protein
VSWTWRKWLGRFMIPVGSIGAQHGEGSWDPAGPRRPESGAKADELPRCLLPWTGRRGGPGCSTSSQLRMWPWGGAVPAAACGRQERLHNRLGSVSPCQTPNLQEEGIHAGLGTGKELPTSHQGLCLPEPLCSVPPPCLTHHEISRKRHLVTLISHFPVA